MRQSIRHYLTIFLVGLSVLMAIFCVVHIAIWFEEYLFASDDVPMISYVASEGHTSYVDFFDASKRAVVFRDDFFRELMLKLDKDRARIDSLSGEFAKLKGQ